MDRGRATIPISQLSIEAVDNRWVKMGETNIEVHMRMYLSVFPETRPDIPSEYVHLHEEVMPYFKTGDLIVSSCIGLFPSLVKISSDSPSSQVSMVFKAPNRWTRKVELFLVEISRNIDRMVCSFTEEVGPRSGLNIFRLEERLYQINATVVWWVPLKKAMTRAQESALTEYIWKHIQTDLSPSLDEVNFLFFLILLLIILNFFRMNFFLTSMTL